MTSGFSRRYGASPGHLVALVVGTAVSVYSVTRITSLQTLLELALWFGGLLLLHDVVLFPLYAGADRALQTVGRGGHSKAVPVWLNHVRIPVALSAVLLLASLPLILRLSPGYERAANRSAAPYLWHWVLLTVALGIGSAVLYVLRRRKSRAPAGQSSRENDRTSGESL